MGKRMPIQRVTIFKISCFEILIEVFLYQVTTINKLIRQLTTIIISHPNFPLQSCAISYLVQITVIR
ncbi:hypothetical protein DMB90_11870 [Raoultella planticola]|uniref:Uncharacterized protein n=1 Tax=Raoultella planticola TaxID=575 RepID=A0A5P6AA83_RAOPL|nr:hypothetical protein DMB90_11870 [Raoultella planticola]